MSFTEFQTSIDKLRDLLNNEEDIKKSQITNVKGKINRLIEKHWESTFINHNSQHEIGSFYSEIRWEKPSIDRGASTLKKLIKLAKEQDIDFESTKEGPQIKEICDYLDIIKIEFKENAVRAQEILEGKRAEKESNDADPYRKFYVARRSDIETLKSSLESRVEPLLEMVKQVYTDHYKRLIDCFEALEPEKKTTSMIFRRTSRNLYEACHGMTTEKGMVGNSYSRELVIRPDIDDFIKKNSEAHAKFAVEQFVYKQISKIAPLMEHDTMKDLKVKALVNGAGTLNSSLRVDMDSGLSFSANTQLVTAFQHSQWVYRYPTLFQNVEKDGVHVGKKLSEKQMHELAGSNKDKGLELS